MNELLRRYHRFTLYAEDGTFAVLEPGTSLAYREEREHFERFDGALDVLVLSRTLTVEASDVAFLSQVEAWQKLGVPVRAFVEGDGSHIVWLTPAVPTLTPTEGRAPGVYAREIRLHSADPSASVAEAVNLLAPLGWLGLTDMPEAYELTEPTHSSSSLDATGLGTFTGEENATTGLRVTARAPKPGRTVTANMVVVSHDADSGQGGFDDLRLRALCLDALGEVLTSGTSDIASGDAGEVSASVVVPVSCVEIAWQLELTVGSQPPGGIRTVDFRTPTLRIDGPGVSSL